MSESTSPKLRDQYSDLVRQSVLAAARRLFAANGYANTPVRQLADEAGVAVQTIYSSFGSKDGVLVALLELVDQSIGMDELQRALVDAQTPGDIAAAVAHMHRVLFESYGDIGAMVAYAGPFDASLAPLLERIQARRRSGAERLCERLVAMGQMDASRVEDTVAHLELVTHERTYEFIKSRGWPIDHYEAWLRDEVLLVIKRS